jgi:hypothetical protein
MLGTRFSLMSHGLGLNHDVFDGRYHDFSRRLLRQSTRPIIRPWRFSVQRRIGGGRWNSLATDLSSDSESSRLQPAPSLGSTGPGWPEPGLARRRSWIPVRWSLSLGISVLARSRIIMKKHWVQPTVSLSSPETVSPHRITGKLYRPEFQTNLSIPSLIPHSIMSDLRPCRRKCDSSWLRHFHHS